MTRRPAQALFCLGLTFVGTPTAPGADPLLREDWIAGERARVQGLVSRLTELIESPADRYQVPDGSGRNFYIDDRGGLHFEPLYDGAAGNWRPVVPAVRDAPLYLTEAQVLYARGLKDEALYLTKALRSMAMFASTAQEGIGPELRAVIVRDAAQAGRWMDELQRRDTAFDRLNRLTDPWAFYNGEQGWTMVLSDLHGWRLRLPGSWRFQRGQDAATRAGDPRRNMVYLQHNEWRIQIGSDVWESARRFPKLQDFVREWDLRRSLNGQRKRVFNFRREEVAEDLDVCARVGSPPTRCALFRTSLQADRRAYHFREYYRLRDNRGFYLEFLYARRESGDPEANEVLEDGTAIEANVTSVMRQMVDSIRFTSGGLR